MLGSVPFELFILLDSIRGIVRNMLIDVLTTQNIKLTKLLIDKIHIIQYYEGDKIAATN